MPSAQQRLDDAEGAARRARGLKAAAAANLRKATEEVNLMSARAFLADERHRAAEMEAARTAAQVDATKAANLARLAREEADAAVRAARAAQQAASRKAVAAQQLARSIPAEGPEVGRAGEKAAAAAEKSTSTVPEAAAAKDPASDPLSQAAVLAGTAAEAAGAAASRAHAAAARSQAAVPAVEPAVARRAEAQLREARELHACSNLSCVAMGLPPWLPASLRPRRRVPRLWVEAAGLAHGGGPVPHETLVLNQPGGLAPKMHAFAPRRARGDHVFVELFQGPPHVCHACETASVVVLAIDARQACRPTREIMARLPLHGQRAPFVRPAGILLTLPLPDAAGLFAAALIRQFGYLSPAEAVGAEPAEEGAAPAAASQPAAVVSAAASAAAAPATTPALIGEDQAISAQVHAYCAAMADRLTSETEVRAALEAAWTRLAAAHVQRLTRALQRRVARIGQLQPARKLRLAPHPVRGGNAVLLAQQQLASFKQGAAPNQCAPPAHFPALTKEERWALVRGFIRANLDPLWTDASRGAKAAADVHALLAVLCRACALGGVNLESAAWRVPELEALADEDGDALVFLTEVWGSCMLKPSPSVYPNHPVLAAPPAPGPGVRAEATAKG